MATVIASLRTRARRMSGCSCGISLEPHHQPGVDPLAVPRQFQCVVVGVLDGLPIIVGDAGAVRGGVVKGNESAERTAEQVQVTDTEGQRGTLGFVGETL